MNLKKYVVEVKAFSGAQIRVYVRAQNVMEASEMFWRETDLDLDACINIFIEEIG